MLVMTRDRPSGNILYTIEETEKKEYRETTGNRIRVPFPRPFKKPSFHPNQDIIQRILESFAIFQLNMKNLLLGATTVELDMEHMQYDMIEFLSTRIT